MFKTILAATDNSEHARKAVALAGDLAEKYGAKLVLVHVVNPKQLTPDARHMAEVEHLVDTGNKAVLNDLAFATPGDWSTRIASLRDNAELTNKVLMALGQHVLTEAKDAVHSGGKVVTRLEEGEPVERILACAADEKADLIVLGSRGLSDLKGLMMGSVSHKVSQLAKCTCVTVK